MATDLLIIPLKLLQDVFARIGIVNQGISLRTMNELEVPRSWLTEYRLGRHVLVAERDCFSFLYTDPDLECRRSTSPARCRRIPGPGRTQDTRELEIMPETILL